MDFAMSAKAQDYHKRLSAFMTEFVFPAEAEYDRHRAEAGPNDHTVPPVVVTDATTTLTQAVWTNAEQWAYGRSCARCDVGLRSSFAYDEVRPYIMRFPDGEIVQIALDDMLSLRRTQWGVR
jgi:hypothetical protein